MWVVGFLGWFFFFFLPFYTVPSLDIVSIRYDNMDNLIPKAGVINTD